MSASTKSEFLKRLKCCLNNDGHIVFEPVEISCGAFACKNCMNDLNETSYKCSNCNKRHEKKELEDKEINEEIETIIKSSLSGLFKDLEAKIDYTVEALMGIIC